MDIENYGSEILQIKEKRDKKTEWKKWENMLINTENTISNSLIFYHKPSTLPPWIKNAQIFFLFASLDKILIQTYYYLNEI